MFPPHPNSMSNNIISISTTRSPSSSFLTDALRSYTYEGHAIHRYPEKCDNLSECVRKLDWICFGPVPISDHKTHTHTSSPHPSLPLAILFSPHDDRIKHKCRAREPSDAMMLNRHDQRTRKSAHSRACLINDIRGRREERSPAARCGGGLHQAQQQQQQRVGGWVSFVLPLTEPNILEMYIRNKDSDIEYDDDDDASERFVFFARLARSDLRVWFFGLDRILLLSRNGIWLLYSLIIQS